MTNKKNQIPEFKSIQEEAEFWDTHDFTDYTEGFKPVKMKFLKNLSEGITIRFDTQTLNTLRQAANKKGIGPTTLVRMWILERLDEDQPKAAHA